MRSSELIQEGDQEDGLRRPTMKRLAGSLTHPLDLTSHMSSPARQKKQRMSSSVSSPNVSSPDGAMGDFAYASNTTQVSIEVESPMKLNRLNATPSPLRSPSNSYAGHDTEAQNRVRVDSPELDDDVKPSPELLEQQKENRWNETLAEAQLHGPSHRATAMHKKLEILSHLDIHISNMKMRWEEAFKKMMEEKTALQSAISASLEVDVLFVKKHSSSHVAQKDIEDTVEAQKRIYLEIFETISEDIGKGTHGSATA
ncbi:hypothetical protein TrVE_jg12334 [Triparma verrucosa]|uniref:Uncharacterized protein n=1 Tax=Triparma verrucosa TaxID=1606542 RepID=A0A9W7BEE5_9STRA|nr:hypothetical protein TrVE_jg12334 [Triparma verrucosa]